MISPKCLCLLSPRDEGFLLQSAAVHCTAPIPSLNCLSSFMRNCSSKLSFTPSLRFSAKTPLSSLSYAFGFFLLHQHSNSHTFSGSWAPLLRKRKPECPQLSLRSCKAIVSRNQKFSRLSCETNVHNSQRLRQEIMCSTPGLTSK